MKMNETIAAQTKLQTSSLGSWLGGSVLLTSTLLHPACTGTEADNPVMDPVDTTLCKGSEEFEPLASGRENLDVDDFSGRRPISAQVNQKSQRLLPLEDIPVWLECLEWSFFEGTLDYQVANFHGGCEIDWTGGANVISEGHVSVELENESCAVAACGSCLYDLRSSGNLELASDTASLVFDLVRLDCDGDVTSESTWTLPLSTQPLGLLCQKADLWGAEKVASNVSNRAPMDLYSPCGTDAPEPSMACADGLTCIAGNCVPPCTENTDCPLSGALECRDGYCQLPE